MKINQLLFRTVDPESVEVSSRRLLKYGDESVDSLQAGPKRYTKFTLVLMGAALNVKAKLSAPYFLLALQNHQFDTLNAAQGKKNSEERFTWANKLGANPIILKKKHFLFHLAWIKSLSCFFLDHFYALLLRR